MPVYEYKAFSEKGETRTGVIDADTPREARRKLKHENLHVVGLKVIKDVSKSSSRGFFHKIFVRKRQIGELAMVTRQLATLLQAGIPMAESMRALIEQIENKKLESVFRDVREKVTQGLSFAEALAHHPSYFSDLYVNMIKAGEAAGNLDTTLMRLAEYMLKQNRVRNKIQAALMYPMVMVAVGVIVISVLMTVVVPKLVTLIKQKDAVLPTPTKILIISSNFLVDYWYILLLACIAVYLAWAAIRRTEQGRFSTDKMMLKMPIFGDLFNKQAISRFAVTFSTLLKSGVPVLEGLLIVKNIVGNAVVAKVLDTVHTRIMEGTDISSPLKKSGVFPPAVGYMIAVGEQSGELEDILETIASSYDEEIEIATQKMTALIEPVLILVMASVVAFIVLSIILPMLQLSQVG